MITLIESLERQIKRLEAKHGSEEPYVKDLKEQLRASKANANKSTQEVYQMQAVQFPPSAEKMTPEEVTDQQTMHKVNEDGLLTSLDDITPPSKGKA